MNQISWKRRKETSREKFEEIIRNAENIPHHIRLYEHPRSQRHMGSYGYMSNLSEGVPADGYYFFAFDATALHRTPPYEKNFSGTRKDEPFRLVVVPGNIEVGHISLNPWNLNWHGLKWSTEKEKYSARIWLDKGSTPRIIFLNGRISLGVLILKLQSLFGKRRGLPHSKPEMKISSTVSNTLKTASGSYSSHVLTRSDYRQMVTRTQKEMIGGNEFDPNLVYQNLKNFLTRAYRRPPSDGQIQSLHQIYRNRISKGLIHGRHTRIP